MTLFQSLSRGSVPRVPGLRPPRADLPWAGESHPFRVKENPQEARRNNDQAEFDRSGTFGTAAKRKGQEEVRRKRGTLRLRRITGRRALFPCPPLHFTSILARGEGKNVRRNPQKENITRPEGSAFISPDATVQHARVRVPVRAFPALPLIVCANQ